VRRWGWLLGAYAAAAALGWALDGAPRLDRPWSAPSAAHWLGTDQIGRDLLALTLAGARTALAVGLLAGGVATLIGAALGLLAGWRGGLADRMVTLLTAWLAAVPGILLVVVLGFLLGGGFLAAFLAVGLVSWIGTARLVRAETRRLRAAPFVEAALAGGAAAPRLVARHLLPNLAPLLGVQGALAFLYAIKAEIVLAFLGASPAGSASWGTLLADAAAFDDLGQGRWARVLAATIAMALLALATQRLADALRERS
jgi:ABC-type dipeptide/oligopeptide/nickel transport system permease subunit